MIQYLGKFYQVIDGYLVSSHDPTVPVHLWAQVDKRSFLINGQELPIGTHMDNIKAAIKIEFKILSYAKDPEVKRDNNKTKWYF
jgi:hypothetical protein